MIEMCGKLYKSNPELRFRCLIFRLGFISSSRTFILMKVYTFIRAYKIE